MKIGDTLIKIIPDIQSSSVGDDMFYAEPALYQARRPMLQNDILGGKDQVSGCAISAGQINAHPLDPYLPQHHQTGLVKFDVPTGEPFNGTDRVFPYAFVGQIVPGQSAQRQQQQQQYRSANTPPPTQTHRPPPWTTRAGMTEPNPKFLKQSVHREENIK